MPDPREINPDIIHTEAIYGARTKQPLVILKWGKESGMFSPDEARRFALRILATAEASIGDAFWWEFAKNKIGLTDQAAVGVMKEYRQWRLRKEEEN